MNRLASIALMGLLLFLLLPVPLVAARTQGPGGGSPEGGNNQGGNNGNGSGGGDNHAPSRVNYSLSITASGAWVTDTSFQCPPQCVANTGFSGQGTLTYFNATYSNTVVVYVNGTSHENWAGVTRYSPCATVSGSIDLTTPTHDKIHLKYTGEGCMVFVHGIWTGKNSVTATFNIMSGEGLFSEASGTGIISGVTHPRALGWSASVGGTISFVPKSED